MNDKEIGIEYLYSNLFKIPELKIYIDIVKRLNNKNILNLCSIDPTFIDICNNPSFWKELIKEKYPEYSSPKIDQISTNYNWKNVYLGLDTYKMELGSLKNYDTLEYLLFEGFWKNFDIFMVATILKDPGFYEHPNYIKMFNYLTDNVAGNALKDTLGYGASVKILETLETLFAMKGEKFIETLNIAIIIYEILRHSHPYIEKYDWLTKRARNPYSNKDYLEDYKYAHPSKLQDHILSKIKDITKEELMSSMQDMIRSSTFPSKLNKLYKKFGAVLSAKIINELRGYMIYLDYSNEDINKVFDQN